jgi:hypothetical protein
MSSKCQECSNAEVLIYVARLWLEQLIFISLLKLNFTTNLLLAPSLG